MKKITLIVLLLAYTFTVDAQNYYEFSYSQDNYEALENTISINNGQVWKTDYFGTFEMPFDFSVSGNEVDRFTFHDNNFLLLEPETDYPNENEGVYTFSNTNIPIQDREYSTGNSASEISYKVEGAEGNRILKLEVKNAGLEDAQEFEVDENFYFLSYQIWMYEADHSIEYHYGEHNITNEVISEINPALDGLLIIFGNQYVTMNVVYGDSSAPEYEEFIYEEFPQEELDTIILSPYPENGTVYRFAPAETASVDDFTTTKLEVYPNPVTSILNIVQDNFTEGAYTITDITGKTVMQNSISTNNTQVNVESLTSGIYFLNMGNKHIKFIKK